MNINDVFEVPHSNSLTDLDSVKDDLEREATVGIIHNCELRTCTVEIRVSHNTA